MFKRFREKYKSSRNLQIFIVACGAILFYLLLNHLGVVRDGLVYIFGVLGPVIVAALLAFLLNPIVSFFEKKVLGRIRVKRTRLKRCFCVIFTVVLICVIILLILYFTATQLASSIKHLINNFDNYVQRLVNMLSETLGDMMQDVTVFGVNLTELETTGIQEFGKGVVNWITGHYVGIIGGAMSVGSNIFNTLITVMLTIYMLIDVEHLKKFGSRFFRSVMEPEKYVRFAQMCSNGSRIFIRYFGSNIIDSAIIGVACYIFMLATGLPYSLLIAVIVGITNFVPTFGPIVGAVMGGFLILLVNPLGTVWFIIYEIVSQFVDANILKPKLFGDTTGLRPMWVLAAIIICGGLFGVVGMLLGVPLFAIFAIVVNEHIETRLQRWDYVKDEDFEDQA